MTMKTCLITLGSLFILIAIIYTYIMSAKPLTAPGVSLNKQIPFNNHASINTSQIKKSNS